MINMARYNRWADITPSDTVDFLTVGKGASAQALLCDAVYVGGAGDVAAVDQAGNVTVFKAVPVGTILPIQARRINSTNTTATLLRALYQI